MDNSVKALYIAAGMLLGVMILSVWVYIFSQGASLGRNYDADKKTEQITAFNGQFDKYIGKAKQNDSDKGYSFEEKSNVASDIVTCASLAYDINRKNDYDVENHVEIVVEMPSSKTYHIYPDERQSKDAFSITSFSNKISFSKFLKDYSNVKIVNITSSRYNSSSEAIYQYYFDLDASKLEYSEITGKIKKVTFTVYETRKFLENGEGHWSENI